MIRAVANLLPLLIPRKFSGNTHTMQIRADFFDKRRDLRRPAATKRRGAESSS
jgi:hypothetical protein